MKNILLLTLLLGLITAASAANIVIMVVEDPNNYEAPRTMRDFAEKQLRPLGHHVTIIDGDKPQPHHFAGLVEALKDADLLVLFSRRRFPPKDQMDAIRAHLAAGKPLLGIRTATTPSSRSPKKSSIPVSFPGRSLLMKSSAHRIPATRPKACPTRSASPPEPKTARCSPV